MTYLRSFTLMDPTVGETIFPGFSQRKKKRNNSTDATDKVVDVVLRQHH